MASPLLVGRPKAQTVGLLGAALPSPYGDAVGLLADGLGYAEDPKSLTWGSGLLSLAGLIPGVPSKRAIPEFLYHGAVGKAVERFKPTPSRRTMGFLGAEREVTSPSFFLSESPYMARQFGENRAEYVTGHGGDAVLGKYRPAVKNPLDLTGPRREVVSALKTIGVDAVPDKRQMWELLDDPDVVAKIRSAGYDSAVISEANAAKEFGRGFRFAPGYSGNPFKAPEAARTWAIFDPELVSLVR